jgi:DNA-binding transcriptional regulator YdaS (Cro superfamily)
MSTATTSPVAWVQVMQALVARELVQGFGLPERQAASLLGIVPSSVSQYLSGKRLGPALARYLGNEEARRIARATAQQLMEPAAGPRVVLEAAIALGELYGTAGSAPSHKSGTKPSPAARREIPRSLRRRIAGEQNAVAECMKLAQRSRDELTRALFRQIASDSLRHAEIVASLGAYLDRGISSSIPTGITRADVEHLIEREHDAEETGASALGEGLGGVMRILWDSMEADERKHELLLQRLLVAGLPDGTRRAKPRTRSP